MSHPPDRRQVIRMGVLGTLGLAACKGGAINDDDPIFDNGCSPEPQDCAVTADDIEGPFWIEGVPVRSDLSVAGDGGVVLKLGGQVRDGACAVVAGAVVEIWHADPSGAYDDSEALLYRGQVETDADGTYAFTTIVPGRYLNGSRFRPSHVHMKVHLGGVEQLTTQLYFVGDPHLDDDAWAEAERTVCLVEEDGAQVAIFDIALA